MFHSVDRKKCVQIYFLFFLTGSNHLYVFMHPLNKEGSEDLPPEITWEFAQKEIAQVKGFTTSTGAGLTKGNLFQII